MDLEFLQIRQYSARDHLRQGDGGHQEGQVHHSERLLQLHSGGDRLNLIRVSQVKGSYRALTLQKTYIIYKYIFI